MLLNGIAVSIVIGVVGSNGTAYHLAVEDMAAYSDAIEAGHAAALEGRWDAAGERYMYATAFASTTNRHDRFFPEAARLIQVDALLEAIQLPVASVNLEAVAWYGVGRSYLASGDVHRAIDVYGRAWTAEPRLEQARFVAGEALWRDGRHRLALEQYGTWAVLPAERRGAHDLALYRTILAECESPDPMVAAAALRRVGRWPEAVAHYQRLADRGDAPAEALFNLGVAARLEDRLDDAMAWCVQALERAPNHAGAERMLARLRAAGERRD